MNITAVEWIRMLIYLNLYRNIEYRRHWYGLMEACEREKVYQEEKKNQN